MCRTFKCFKITVNIKNGKSDGLGEMGAEQEEQSEEQQERRCCMGCHGPGGHWVRRGGALCRVEDRSLAPPLYHPASSDSCTMQWPLSPFSKTGTHGPARNPEVYFGTRVKFLCNSSRLKVTTNSTDPQDSG